MASAPANDRARPAFGSRVDGHGRIRIYATDAPVRQWLAARPSNTVDLEDHR